MKTLLTLLAMGLLASSGGSFASDSHNFNGIGCKADYEPYPYNAYTPLERNAYGIQNKNLTYSTRVYCPVPVDAVGNLNGTESITVQWRSLNSTDVIQCHFYNTDSNGLILQSQLGFKKGSGEFTIANITKDQYYGTYGLTCSLPPMGLLQTYRVTEKH